jgi:hypothetical protein
VEKDFAFKDGIYLVTRDHELDLHNEFDFTEVRYSVRDRTVSLSWVGGSNGSRSVANPVSIRLDFVEVSEFRFMPRDPELPFTEDFCLHAAGYWIEDERIDGVAIPESEPGPEWFTAFEFISGAIIALKAARATTRITMS